MRVVVTGCSRGIGHWTAAEFARRGHHVIATARNLADLAGLDVKASQALDVTDDQAVRRVIGEAGAIDVLVNAAGAPLVACPAEVHPIDAAQAIMDVNFYGAWRTIQAALPGMRERGKGTIVNVSSVIGRVARPLRAAHAASKFALEALSEALKYEVGHFGIRVLVVQPGATEKEKGAATFSWDDRAPAYRDLFSQIEGGDRRLAAAVPVQSPETVARQIVDAVEGQSGTFRLVVGRDAAMVLGARAACTDAEFEAKMRSVLGVTW